MGANLVHTELAVWQPNGQLSTPDHTLEIPVPGAWMNANARRRTHWAVDAERTRTWRAAAGWSARAAGLPSLGPSRVIAGLLMTRRRRAHVDPANYAPTAKACVDGLVDAGIWPDDSADWLEGPDMRLHPGYALPPERPEALVLLIWGRPCCADAACHHHHEGAGR